MVVGVARAVADGDFGERIELVRTLAATALSLTARVHSAPFLSDEFVGLKKGKIGFVSSAFTFVF